MRRNYSISLIKTIAKTGKNVNLPCKWKENNPLKVHSKSRSLLSHNLLTKSYFSLNDASPGRQIPLRSTKEGNGSFTASHRPSVLLEMHHRRFFEDKNKIQRAHSQVTNNRKIQSIFFKECSQSNRMSMPKVNLKKITQQNGSISSITSGNFESQRVKFKLLFKEQRRLTYSQRKIMVLDRKIQDLGLHRQSLKKMMPIEREGQAAVKIKPKGIIITRQKIDKLIDNLITISESFFNTFIYPKKVGVRIRTIEGFNSTIKEIMMEDDWKARRITDRTILENRFWIYKLAQERIQFFGQEDQALYIMLNNFQFRMEKLFKEQRKAFATLEFDKARNMKLVLAKQINKFEKTHAVNQKMQQITKFVESRKIHNQARRQNDIKSLQKLGVHFNATELAKGLVLRQKQKAMTNFKLADFKQPQHLPSKSTN